MPKTCIDRRQGPRVLVNWPAPDAAIGGSKGNLAAIMDAALVANPACGFCISAIALETFRQAIAVLAAHGLTVSHADRRQPKAGGGHPLADGQQPGFLIGGSNMPQLV